MTSIGIYFKEFTGKRKLIAFTPYHNKHTYVIVIAINHQSTQKYIPLIHHMKGLWLWQKEHFFW